MRVRGLSRMRGSPIYGAPTSSSNGRRWASANGSSSSRLGLRSPDSRREACSWRSGLRRQRRQRHAASLAEPRSRGPTSASTSGIAGSSPWRRRYRRFPETATKRCDPRPRGARCEHMDPETYDVAIVGGGAAGLSAALVLGRARRRVVVGRRRGAAQRARRAHAGVPLPRRDAPGRAARHRRGPRFGVTAWRSSRTAWCDATAGFALGSPAADASTPAGAARDRGRRRAARRPRRPRALGPRPAALPVLPRLGGARPAARGARARSSTPNWSASGPTTWSSSRTRPT